MEATHCCSVRMHVGFEARGLDDFLDLGNVFGHGRFHAHCFVKEDDGDWTWHQAKICYTMQRCTNRGGHQVKRQRVCGGTVDPHLNL